MSNKKLLFSNFIFILAIISYLTSGCVSVAIESPEIQPAEDLSYTAPPAPYTKIDDDSSLSWQNKSNGNSISLYSNCNKVSDLTLEQLQQETLNAINSPKIIKNKNVTFNKRKALDSVFTGDLDGVPIKLQSMVFRKNDCLYNIHYIATSKNFSTDLNIFQQFLQSFKAP